MIYDCFLYNGEDDLVEIRLNTIGYLVDYFVIAESCWTFQNKKKDFQFKITPEIEKYKDKIIYVQCGLFDRKMGPHPTTWDLERNLRDFGILEGIKEASDDSIIMISDADEIPNPLVLPEIYNQLTRNPIKQFVVYMNYYMYGFNLRTPECNSWPGTSVVLKRNMRTPQQIREERVDLDKVKVYGGWHYTYLIPLSNIQNKLNSFSHYELNTPEINNVDNIAAAIEQKRSFYNSTTLIVDNMLPLYIERNKERFEVKIL